MPIAYYRYVGVAEKQHVEGGRSVYSYSGLTFLTPDLYPSAEEARKRLALPTLPVYRAGPFHEHELPPLTVPHRVVAPANGQPGGGVECAVSEPIVLFGFRELL